MRPNFYRRILETCFWFQWSTVTLIGKTEGGGEVYTTVAK